MKSKKLVESMAVTLTAVFVALGAIAYYGYAAAMSFLSGGIGAGFSIDLIFNLACPLLVALAGFVLIILCFIGKSKANHEESSKGLFITTAVFQMIFAVAAIAESGWWIYTMCNGVAIADLIHLLILEISLLVCPVLFAGIAVLIAFVKTCKGNKGENMARETAPVMEDVQPQQQAQAESAPTPPPFPPKPPEFGN